MKLFPRILIFVMGIALSSGSAFALGVTSPSPLPNGTVASFYSTSLTASGGRAPYSWIVVSCTGACNTGLGFTQSGTLSGLPQNAGTSTFTFKVTDARGSTASQMASLTIAGNTTTSADALAVSTPSTLPSGFVSTPYSSTLTASGGSAPYTWTISHCSGSCNTGLGFNPSGVLSGTPVNAGTSAFTFVVKDALGQTASGTSNITIALASSSTSPPASLSITSPSILPNGSTSAAYSVALSASGGTTPYTWFLNSCTGVCDSNLSLTSSGVFSGTPVKSGTSTYAFSVNDAGGQSASAQMSLTIAAAAPATAGASFYVSPSGSDTNSCSQSSPCATPDHAFNLASPGNTVQVAPGTYDYGSSAAQFTKSGTSGNDIKVTCATRGACRIQNSVTGNSTVVVLGGSYITFDGFEVTNTSSAGNNLGLYVTSSYVNITHNTIHHIETDCGSNGGGGIQVAGSGSSNSDLHNITIDGNWIYDISYRGGVPSCPASTVQTDGILAETAGTALQVTNNVVYHTSGGWGILVGNPNAVSANVNTSISNNTVFSTAMGGIIIVSGNGTTISNNMVLNTGSLSGRCAVSAPSGIAVNYANNDLWNNAGGSYCLDFGSSNQSVHAGDLAVDPALGTTFVNWQADGSGDYHQRSGAPTIDRGSATGVPPNVDFDGSARPRGAGYDIGAYEYPN